MAVCGHRPKEGGALTPCHNETRQGCVCAVEVYADVKREQLAELEEPT